MRIINLKRYLKANSMTQLQLAKFLNLAPSTINGYCSGSSEPDLDTLVKICKILNVTIEDLLDVGGQSLFISTEDLKLIDYHQKEISKIIDKYRK